MQRKCCLSVNALVVSQPVDAPENGTLCDQKSPARKTTMLYVIESVAGKLYAARFFRQDSTIRNESW